MNKQTVKDIDFKGKKVILRADFNVPLDEHLNITDDRRIKAAVPTIQYILGHGAAKLILMSHLGRPKGEVIDSMRLTPVTKALQKLLGEEILKLDDCIGDEVKKKIGQSSQRVILLENLRFHKEETKNDPEFSKQLASLADIYVNDAFGTAHRAHASTVGVTEYLPAVAGFLLEKEINYLGQALENPKKPFMVILGGAKVSDKILLVENLIPRADAILIAGGMAYTFLKAQGKNIGNSILEEDKLEIAKGLMEKAKEAGVDLVFPVDFVITEDFNSEKNTRTVKDIPNGWESLDIGPESVKKFTEVLSKAKTVVWNGPVGVFEKNAFAAGTKAVAECLAELKDAITIIGGGDSAAAVSKFKVEDAMTHISTGGGASLEFLEGKQLPGVVALNEKEKINA